MPANILNLSDFKVQRVEEADHDYHVYAEVSNSPGVCTACGSDRLIGHGRNEQIIRDLPTHGKRLAIYVDTRRWRCQSCGKTVMEAQPAVNARREPELAAAEEVIGYGVPNDAMGYGLPLGYFGKAVLTPRKGAPKAEHPHEPPGPPKNYGADMNTLIGLLESGRL